MSESNDGGLAFPSATQAFRDQPGMSLRDWFAGQALSACARELWGEYDGTESIAAAAYQIADAMLAERAKRGAK